MASDISARSPAAVVPALSRSEMSGSGVLIVVGEPVNQLDKDAILKKITDGFSSWDSDQTGCDINAELSEIASAAPTGVAGVNGEHTIHGESANLHVDVLINPLIETVTDALRVLLLLPTKHKHVIYAGYGFERTGNWILQDGSFTFADLSAVVEQRDVAAALQEEQPLGGGRTLALHCLADGHWQEAHVRASELGRRLHVSVNPAAQRPQEGSGDGVVRFAAYLSLFVNPFGEAAEALQTSTILGSLNFERPTVYAFPAGRGDCALFGISGFNMLVDGGAARRSCFWPCVRHINCLDVLVVSHVGENSVLGLKSFLQKKAAEPSTRPAIGHVYFNGRPADAAASGSGKELTVDLAHEAGQLAGYLHAAGCSTSHCHSSAAATSSSKEAPVATPVNLYHKIGHGSLDMYVLNPSKESAGKATAAVDGTSSVAILLVWKPVSPSEKVTRILFPGSTPQAELLKAFEKLKHLDALRASSEQQQRPKTASAAGTPSKSGPAAAPAAAAKKLPPSKLTAAESTAAAAPPRSSTPASSAATPAAEATPASPAAAAAAPVEPAVSAAATTLSPAEPAGVVEDEHVATPSAAAQRSATPSSRSITKSPSPSPPKSPSLTDDDAASAALGSGPSAADVAAANDDAPHPAPEEDAHAEVDEEGDQPAVAWQDDDETKPEALPEPLCAAGSLATGSRYGVAYVERSGDDRACGPSAGDDDDAPACPEAAAGDAVPDEPLVEDENAAAAKHDAAGGAGDSGGAAVLDEDQSNEDVPREMDTEEDDAAAAAASDVDSEVPADTAEVAAADPHCDKVTEDDGRPASLQVGRRDDSSDAEKRAASPGLADEEEDEEELRGASHDEIAMSASHDESPVVEEPVDAVTAADGFESAPAAEAAEEDEGSSVQLAESGLNDRGQPGECCYADGGSVAASGEAIGAAELLDASAGRGIDEGGEVTPIEDEEWANVAAGSAGGAQPGASTEDVKAASEGETAAAAEDGSVDDDGDKHPEADDGDEDPMADEGDMTTDEGEANDGFKISTDDVKTDDDDEIATEDFDAYDDGKMTAEDVKVAGEDSSEAVTEDFKADDSVELSVLDGDDSAARHDFDYKIESLSDEIGSQDESSAGSNSSTPKPCGTPVDQQAPGSPVPGLSATASGDLLTEDEEPGTSANDSATPLVANEALEFNESDEVGPNVPSEDATASAAHCGQATAQIGSSVDSEPTFESETAGHCSNQGDAAEELPEDSAVVGNQLLDFGTDAVSSNMHFEASSCSASEPSSVRASYCEEDADEISMVAVSGSSAHIADVMNEVGFIENDGDAKPSRDSASAADSIEDIPTEAPESLDLLPGIAPPNVNLQLRFGAGLASTGDSQADMFDPLAEWGAPQHLPSPPSPTPQQSETAVADAPASAVNTNGDAGDGSKPAAAATKAAAKPQKTDGNAGHKGAQSKSTPTKKQPAAKQVNGADGASKAAGDAASKAKGSAPAKPTSAPASAKARPAAAGSGKAGSPAIAATSAAEKPGSAAAAKPKSAPPTARAPKTAPAAPATARSAGEPEAAASGKGPAETGGKKAPTKAAAPSLRPGTAPPAARASKAGSQEPAKGAALFSGPKSGSAAEQAKADAAAATPAAAVKKPKPAAAAAAPAPSAATAVKAAAAAPAAKPAAAAATAAPKAASAAGSKHTTASAKGGHAAATAAAAAVVPFCVDLAYLPHHLGTGAADFFRHVQSRYYVLSGAHTLAAADILDGLLAAKEHWGGDGGRSAAVTVIPIHDSDSLLHWQALNRDRAAALNVDVAPAASRAIIHLQDDEGAFHAYRQEF